MPKIPHHGIASRESGHVQAVLRACEIVKAFRNDGEELHLSAIAERTSLCRTTAFRLLQTLVRGGLLERRESGVTESLQRAALREQVELITVNNRYSPKKALRNADLLIREHADLVLEFQTYERMASIVASKFLKRSCR